MAAIQRDINQVRANTRRPKGSQAVPVTERDTIGYSCSAVIATQDIFSSGINKSTRWRSTTFPANDGNIRHFNFMKARHDVYFTGTAPIPALTQMEFENNTIVRVLIADKGTLGVPLSELLPHIWQVQASTTVAVEAFVKRFRIPGGLTIEDGISFQGRLENNGSFTTAASPTPSKPGLGLTSDQGFAVYLYLDGTKFQPVA